MDCRIAPTRQSLDGTNRAAVTTIAEEGQGEITMISKQEEKGRGQQTNGVGLIFRREIVYHTHTPFDGVARGWLG